MNQAEFQGTKNDQPAATAEITTPDLKVPHKECVTGGRLAPCILVIIGASGDLTSRKLVPALFRLSLEGGLPDRFAVVGCGRTELSDQEFRDKMKDSVAAETGSFNQSDWQAFAPKLFYRVTEDYGDPSSFQRLRESLTELDRTCETEGNRIFYLAIPPQLYGTVAQMIGKAGLAAEGDRNRRWSRIVVEKPFGSNLETAVGLNKDLHEYFQEHQIYRIDHYLAKETVQNILMFRFANSIFEPVWNRGYIEYVSITAVETLGVEHRAGYYEQAGIIRDMFQNHMMQLLSLTAVEPPALFDTEQIRDERAKVFRSLRPFPVDRLTDHIVLGQYGPGVIDGKPVPGYREEPGVSPDSLTPTFASMKVFLDNWRWQGVPFILTSGKRMPKKLTEIVVQFREIPHSLFRNILPGKIPANRLTLGIDPEERITLTFQAKNPGAAVRLRPVAMDFCYNQNYSGPILDAYQKVLIDCIRGDQMLFLREDAVELCWSFLTPILEGCEICADRAAMLHTYDAGSWGPPSFLGY
jgi:glucose-6-phosphate 1-dehydrogenase